MFSDAYLGPKYCSITDFSGASNPRLAHNEHTLADLDVVSHLHQIVDLCPIANSGRTELATVHTTQCTNFNVIADFNIAKMWHSPGKASIRVRPESKAL
jgi:hypothetical protein